MGNFEHLKTLSPEDFALFGTQDFVYVKAVERDGSTAFAIHLANGQPIALADSREAAQATAGDYDVQLLSVH